jgi:hypothetical protein
MEACGERVGSYSRKAEQRLQRTGSRASPNPECHRPKGTARPVIMPLVVRRDSGRRIVISTVRMTSWNRCPQMGVHGFRNGGRDPDKIHPKLAITPGYYRVPCTNQRIINQAPVLINAVLSDSCNLDRFRHLQAPPKPVSFSIGSKPNDAHGPQ